MSLWSEILVGSGTAYITQEDIARIEALENQG
jgi:hypothetical protein